MVDKFKNTSIHDIMFAKALGISEEELAYFDLSKQKNEMQVLAFKYQNNNKDIDMEMAINLNNKYQEIINELKEISDYDSCEDYWIDFKCFVPEYEKYHKFAF